MESCDLKISGVKTLMNSFPHQERTFFSNLTVISIGDVPRQTIN